MKRLLTFTLLSCMLAYHAGSHAQDSLLLRDYRFVKQQEAWLTGPNAAGLTRYRSAAIAEAEVSIGMGRGGFVNYFESPKTLMLTAGIESFYRISQRTVVYGRMNYDNWTGRDMAGSAFIDPTRLPFDIVEDSLTNLGRKHRDTYQLTGAVGCQVTKGMAAGLRIDYTAANYAKYKDLRHKNKLMDLTLTAGLTFSPLPAHRSLFTIGANYRYHRQTESVTFSTYGKGEKVYKSLIDYGNFIGRVEQFGNYGYTDKSREMPLFDEGHGLDVQLELTPADGLSFYNNFGFTHRKGYYGRRSPYTITFTNHHGNRYSYNALLSYRPSAGALHQLTANIDAEVLRNNAETYREMQNEKGSYYYEYYDDVKTGDKRWVNTTLGYTGHYGICHELPTWTVRAVVTLMHRRQTAYCYPYLRRQRLSATGLTAEGTRHIAMRHGVLTVGASIGYSKGSGEPFEDDTFATPSDKQTPPAEMEAWLWQEYQYLTAPQYTVGGNVRYDFIVPGTRLKAHAALNIQHRKANNIYYEENGKDHTQMAIAVGCTF